MHARAKAVVVVAFTGILCGSTFLLTAGAAAAGSLSAVGGRLAISASPNIRAPLPAVRSIHGYLAVDSYNWSGYAQSGADGTFKSVVDTWTVPTVNTSLSGDQYSSDWVGIGGFADSTLVQAGTEADNIGGTALYRAWTEVLPAAESPLSLTISPGDKITTTVKLKGSTWHMTVTDLTTGKSAGRTASQASAGSSEASVEAVHERPCILDGCTSVSDLANLTQTTNVTFDPGKVGTTAKAKTPLMKAVAGATVYQMFMINNADTAVIASPSVPDSDNDGFTVADGSVSPPPPKS